MDSKRFMQTVGLILLVGIFLTVSAPAYADHAGDKLFRGVVNAATGWLELPKNIIETTQKTEGNFFVGITWGTLKGVGATLARTGAGAWEVATFIFPSYESVINPPTLFHGGAGHTGMTK